MQAQAEAAIAVKHSRKIGRTERAGNKTVTAHRDGKEAAIPRFGEPGAAIAAEAAKAQGRLVKLQQRLCRGLIQKRGPGFQEQAVQARQDDNSSQRDQEVK